MPLTDTQCETLRDAILNVYPYENKAALELLLSEEFKVNLEFIASYSSFIPTDNKNINTDNQKTDEKIKILILKIPSKNLDLDREVYEIKLAIKQAKNKSVLDIQDEIAYSTDDIRRAIAEHNPQIVHFCCHGLENGSLNLENDNESEISLDTLKAIFQGRENFIKCVLLNACHSEKASVAITQHIDYAIGMNRQIIDEVAIEFAKGFYDGLGYNNENNDKFLIAFNEGVRAIIAKNNSQQLIPAFKKRISYEDAIFNSIKKINAENKIDDFLQKIRSNISTNQLFNEFYHDYFYPIKISELTNLVEIIRDIQDWNLVTNSYRETLPENSTLDNSELNNPQNIEIIINTLQTQYPVVRNKIPSILEFAKNLAEKFAENSQEYLKIKHWLQDVSSNLKISIPVHPKVESSSIINQKTFLFIILFPEDNKIRLEAEFILDENKNSLPQPFDIKELSNEADDSKGILCDSDEKISLIIDKIINSFMSRFRGKISKPIIEIFLPYKYLGKNLDDEWRIKDDNSQEELIPIVLEYNLILHPLERFTGNSNYANFTGGWSRLTKALESQSPVCSILRDIEIIQKLDSKNYRKIGLELRKKVGLKLTSSLAKKEQDYFFRAVLSGGTPIAFWTRFHTNQNIELNAIDCHLTVECLSNNYQNLIDKICEIRQEAYCNEENPEEFLGYHLGFLCDNFNRTPQRLLQPL